MARQIDRFTIIVNCDRQADGSYKKTIAACEATASDPAPASGLAFDKGPWTLRTQPPAFDGTKTVDAMILDAATLLKTWTGAL